MKKNAVFATLLLVVVIAVGAVYWFSKGYVASSGLQKYLLENYRWLGTILTVLLVAIGVYVLHRIYKKDAK